MIEKEDLPKGKLNIRHRQERGVFQVFAGRNYLSGCSGDTPEIAAMEMSNFYIIPEGTTAIVHGFSEKLTIKIPVKNEFYLSD